MRNKIIKTLILLLVIFQNVSGQSSFFAQHWRPMYDLNVVSLINSNYNIYVYDPTNNTSSFVKRILSTSGSIYAYDVANTNNKLWAIYQTGTGGVGIYEYDIVSTPTFAITYNRSISITGVTSAAGLDAIDNNTLILVAGSTVYTADITSGTASYTQKFVMTSGYSINGDYMLTTDNKFIVLAYKTTSPYPIYLQQYNWQTGVQEVNVDITSSAPYAFGLFQYNGTIYIMAGDKKVYTVNPSTYAITQIADVSHITTNTIHGATCVHASNTTSLNSQIVQHTVLLTSGSYWLSPSNLATSEPVYIECVGGGGGGGNAQVNTTNYNAGAGGGAGGNYAASYKTLAANTSYPISIGSGGDAADGGDTYFNNTSYILAKGGARGSNAIGNNVTGNGGNNSIKYAACIGDVKYAGGNGSVGWVGPYATFEANGGGGGGAAWNATGNNGFTESGGLGTSPYGGYGGDGGIVDIGFDGGSYGGGGGGAGTTATTITQGGLGANGCIFITYYTTN